MIEFKRPNGPTDAIIPNYGQISIKSEPQPVMQVSCLHCRSEATQAPDGRSLRMWP